MKNTPFPFRPAHQSAAKPLTKMVLLYDGFATAVRGKAFCEQLVEQLEVECDLDESLWRTDLLSVPELRREAAAAALTADFVVLSLRGDEELSDEIEHWCEAWMPRARRCDITLVILFDAGTAERSAMENVRSYLRKAAFAAGIHFFGHASVTGSMPFLGAPDRDMETPADSEPPEHLNGKGATILVVDDFQQMRDAICRSLQGGGYQVLIACDGVEAMQMVETNRSSIDLVITDIEMPQLRGDDLACWLRREDPNLPILLMSSGLPAGTHDLGLPFLEKPFSTKTLLATVESLLHSAAAA